MTFTFPAPPSNPRSKLQLLLYSLEVQTVGHGAQVGGIKPVMLLIGGGGDLSLGLKNFGFHLLKSL